MSPHRILSRATLLLIVVVGAQGASGGSAGAAGTDSEEARAYFDKATASFALGHYPVAAENFEKAFEVKPDPALLYNAAQAHRLAGNKERALVLYQNYLRLYARAGKRAEVEARVEELKKAIERDREVATSPPTTTMPSGSVGSEAGAGSTPGFTPAPPASPAGATTAAVTTGGAASTGGNASTVDLRPSPPAAAPTALVNRTEPAQSQSLTNKPLFWAVVAGGVVTAVVVVLVVALSGPKDPSPSLGVFK
jgi:hypothetical protein